jgi:hypothetical protein
LQPSIKNNTVINKIADKNILILYSFRDFEIVSVRQILWIILPL